MPPLVIEDEQLVQGLGILMKVLAETVSPMSMSPVKQSLVNQVV